MTDADKPLPRAPRVEYLKPVRSAGTPIPHSRNGQPLAFPRGGYLYGVDPRGSWRQCPYCGRPSPVGLGGRGEGFRIVGFRNHVGACYWAELYRHGMLPSKYIAAAEAMRLSYVRAVPRTRRVRPPG